MPKPAHEPTSESRSLVERLASIGIPQDKIADVVGLSGPTLRKHYRDQLDGAALRANAAVASNLFAIATGDSPRAVTAGDILDEDARWLEREQYFSARPHRTGTRNTTQLDRSAPLVERNPSRGDQW